MSIIRPGGRADDTVSASSKGGRAVKRKPSGKSARVIKPTCDDGTATPQWPAPGTLTPGKGRIKGAL